MPELLAMRSGTFSQSPEASIPLIWGLGIALIATGFASATNSKDTALTRPWACGVTALLTVLYFLALTLRLQDWWIDDAGITFAYSRSLAEGLGIVAQPWLPVEEGYSSSVWMLLLAGTAWLGAEIPLAAKYLGISFAVICMGISGWIVTHETRSPLAVLICGIGMACGPMVVWASSGQEHALQALLLLLVVVCAYSRVSWRWPVALILSVFVLTRPEAPIIVIAVFLAAVWLTRRAGAPLINAADAAIALLPFATFVALIVFRIIYFGDTLPNPYYAKSSGAGLGGLLNPLSGGWSYLITGLRDTALLFVMALVFLHRPGPQPAWVVIAWALLIGQVFFVVWAKGDWMGQYRFLMPILPLALILVALGVQGLGAQVRRQSFVIVAVLAVTQTNTIQLGRFAANPTTPLAEVTLVGNTFKALADLLGIEDPLLAHHDAGGIAYHRMIRLVDLGGLINRTIAKNMDDKAFLTGYLLEEVQPDFVFGAKNFAAAAGFSETEAFARDYVRLNFLNQPAMSADLVHIRRSLVVARPGVIPVYDAAGAVVSVSIDLLVPDA